MTLNKRRKRSRPSRTICLSMLRDSWRIQSSSLVCHVPGFRTIPQNQAVLIKSSSAGLGSKEALWGPIASTHLIEPTSLKRSSATEWLLCSSKSWELQTTRWSKWNQSCSKRSLVCMMRWVIRSPCSMVAQLRIMLSLARRKVWCRLHPSSWPVWSAIMQTTLAIPTDRTS